MNLTDDQLHTLRHMLGINTPDQKAPKPYRDYAAAVPGDLMMTELEALGAVRCYRRDTYHWYTTTDAGRAAAMASHRTIRRPKASRVYSAFLDVRECFEDLTFKEFLTHPQFAETRRNA